VHSRLLNLAVPGACLNTIMLDSKAAFQRGGTAWRVTAISVDFWGAIMRIDLFNVRKLYASDRPGILPGDVAVERAAPLHAGRSAAGFCSGDVFPALLIGNSRRGPDHGLHAPAKRASLSEGCRKVFGKPAEQSASVK